MKTITKIIVLILLFATSKPVISQVYYDYMGFPTDIPNEGNVGIKNSNEVKNVREIQVDRTFASPTSLPSGITWDGQYLWICGYNEYKIFKVSPSDGHIVETFPTNIQKPYGIAYLNDSLFILDNLSKNIFVLNPLNGLCIDTIFTNNLIYPTGLLYIENQFVFNDNKGPQPSATGDSTLFFTNDIGTIKGFSSFGTFSSGITYDGNYLWINDNPSQTSNKIDPVSLEVIETIATPGGMYPNGITWDGVNMWVINNETDSVYMFSIDNSTEILNTSLNNSFTIYPNPVEDQFNISLNNFKPDVITISSLDGKTIINDKIYNSDGYLSYNVNDLGLSSGVYCISLSNTNTNCMGKLIVK